MAGRARGADRCCDGRRLGEGDQLELVKHQINKMVGWGVYTPPKGWEPYPVKPEVSERIAAAGRRRRS